MNFGVIGPGNIGEVIVRKLRDAGYPVKMANSRGPESLKDLGAKITPSRKTRVQLSTNIIRELALSYALKL